MLYGKKNNRRSVTEPWWCNHSMSILKNFIHSTDHKSEQNRTGNVFLAILTSQLLINQRVSSSSPQTLNSYFLFPDVVNFYAVGNKGTNWLGWQKREDKKKSLNVRISRANPSPTFRSGPVFSSYRNWNRLPTGRAYDRVWPRIPHTSFFEVTTISTTFKLRIHQDKEITMSTIWYIHTPNTRKLDYSEESSEKAPKAQKALEVQKSSTSSNKATDHLMDSNFICI